MSTFDDEYLEVFGGNREVFELVSQKLNQVFNDEECHHENIETFPDLQGYCTDCGKSFKNVEDIKKSGECDHENTYEDENGLYVCSDCHEELQIMDFDPEWKYYGDSGGSNPERCHRSRGQGRGIRDAFTKHNINVHDAIMAQVETKYGIVVGKNTVRGKGRQAIIAACLFHVYIEFGQYRTSDYIRNLFDLKKKQMSVGLTKYYEAFPEARTIHIGPQDLLRWILNLTGVSKENYRKIVQIFRYLENSSALFQRSSPQSVASAIVYFYLCLHPEYKSQLGLTKNTFAEKALLSDITVTKLVREAADISQCIVNM